MNVCKCVVDECSPNISSFECTQAFGTPAQVARGASLQPRSACSAVALRLALIAAQSMLHLARCRVHTASSFARVGMLVQCAAKTDALGGQVACTD
jgi:hypothetical protein